MNTGWKLFLVSGLFGVVTGAVYWFVSSEPAGTLLLLSLGVAPLIVSGYLLLRFRETALPEDRADAGPGDASPEPLGVFVSASVWPVTLALGFALVLVGLVYTSALTALGLLLFGGALVGLTRESR